MGEMATYGLGEVAAEASAVLERVTRHRAGERGRIDVGTVQWPVDSQLPGQGELVVDGQPWTVLDYKEEVWTSEELASVLKLPEPQEERRQCVTRVLAAGVLQRELGRVPVQKEVDVRAEAMRREQCHQALDALEQMGEPEEFVTAVEHELRTYIHDIMSPHHEKDFRSLAVFPLEDLREAKLVVMRADYKGDLLVETVVGPHWRSDGWHVWAMIYRGHMTLVQTPSGWDAVAWLQKEERYSTPSLGFSFFYHQRHDQSKTSPGRVPCRLCKGGRRAGEDGFTSLVRRHSCLASVAALAGSGERAVEVLRSVRPTAPHLLLRELFAGHAVLTKQWERQGGQALQPVEVFENPHTRDGYRAEYDLLRPEVREEHLLRARQGPENVGWIASPCTSYCDWALQNGGTRTFAAPRGAEGGGITQKEQEGNTLSDFGAEYFTTMLDHGGFPICESTAPSGRYPKQWHLPSWKQVLQRPDVDYVDLDMCAFGLGPPDEADAFYKHATRVVFPRHEPLRQALLRVCPGVGPRHRHIPLKGNRSGVPVSRCTEAGVYAHEFVATVVRVVFETLQVGRGGPGFAPRAGRAGGRDGDDQGEGGRAGGQDRNDHGEDEGEEIREGREPEGDDHGEEIREGRKPEGDDHGNDEEEDHREGREPEDGLGDHREGREPEGGLEEEEEEGRERSRSRGATRESVESHPPDTASNAEREEMFWDMHAQLWPNERRRREGEEEDDDFRSAVEVGRGERTEEEEPTSETVSDHFGRDPGHERKRRICRDGPEGGRCGLCPKCNPTSGYLEWGQEVPVWRNPDENAHGAGSSNDRPGDGEEEREVEPEDAWELGPGYVMVRHYRARRTLFVPPEHGEASLGPERFRNERQTHIEYERVDGATGRVRVTDNWRTEGECDPGYGWWRGVTFLTFQGQSLPWQSSSEYTNTSSTDPDDESEPNDDGNTDELSVVEIVSEVPQESTESEDSSRGRRAGGYRAPNDAAAEAAEAYMRTVDQVGGGSPDEWLAVREAGDKLLSVAGSVKRSAESLWEARERLGRNNLAGVDNQRLDSILHPDILAYLRSVRFGGMNARFVGPRQRVKANLHPNAKKNLGQVYSQLWKDIRKQRALVVNRNHSNLETTISSPFEAVDKLLPDRTISPEKRVVHDQRGVNFYTDKGWHPPAAQPSHAQVARRILLWKMRAPGIPILLAKKDVAGAFRLLWVSPEDVELFAGDVPWQPESMTGGGQAEGEEMTIIYLVSSFGFSGSPGEWAIWGRSTEEFHRCHKPEESRRDGSYGFESKILVDDNVLVEPWMGLRPWVSAEVYEEGVRMMLGEAAVNAEKDREEGDFRSQQTVWGIIMDTENQEAHLPERRVLKGAHLLAEECFDAGKKDVTLRQLQILRGIATGWASIVHGLKNELKAIDLFLGGNEPNGPVWPKVIAESAEEEDRKREEAWRDLWEVFEMLRWLCSRSETWGTKFGGKLYDLLSARERLSCPGQWEEAVIVTSDATPTMIGAVDWTNGFSTRAAVELLWPWIEPLGEDEGDMKIHVAEFLSLVVFACEVAGKWQGRMVLYGGDNQLVRSWVNTRRSKVRACRLLIRVLNMVEMRYNVVVVCGWLRTYHNETADFITRCEEKEYWEKVEEKKWTHVELKGRIQQALEDSRQFGPCFLGWCEDEDRGEILRLKERRLHRQVPAGIDIAWEKVAVREFVEGTRMIKDFEAARRAAGRPATVGAHVVVMGTLGPDESNAAFRRMIEPRTKEDVWMYVVEGPRASDWGLRERVLKKKGWSCAILDFVTTELGEGAARSRCALVAWKYEVVTEDVGKFVVKGATARPMATIVGNVKRDSEALVWDRPSKLSLEPGIPRDRLLPQVVGHFWMKEEDDRANLHGLGGPMRWPLRAKEGGREVLWVHDRQGPAGCVRRLTPLEVWMCQGRTREEWYELRGRGWEEEDLKEEGCKGTGFHTASQLVLMAGAVVTEQVELRETARAGACRDEEGAEAMAKLLTWLRKWRQGEFGINDRRAGGCALREITRLGDVLWWEALKSETYGEEEERDRMAGKRKGRLVKTETVEGPGKVISESERKIPFNGDVGLHVEEWLEANLTGDLAGSTEKMYKGAWAKWQAWARRHAWESELLSPSRSKLENEDRLLGFLAYVGWTGGSAATVKQVLFAVKAMHKRLGAGDPTEGMHRIWILANAMERKSDKKPRRLGVTPDMMRWLHKQLDEEGQVGEFKIDCVMLRAAVTLAWFFMLRIKEYADSGGVDMGMIVRGCDVKLSRDGEATTAEDEANELTLQFRKTKADQHSFGDSKTVVATGVPGLCPVEPMVKLRRCQPQRFGNSKEALQPLFRWAKGTTLKRLEVQALLQKAAIAQNLPPSRFMSHSLRIGGASALFQATGEIETVKRAGRWSSSTVQRYLWDGGKTKEYSKQMANATGLLHYT